MSEDEKKQPEGTPSRLGWTEEEERQMEKDRAEHPWELTLAQFLDLVQRRYGFELLVADRGATVVRYLRSSDGAFVGLLPVGLAMHDRLDEFSTASLCRLFRIPPEDFGLSREALQDGEDEALN